MTKLDMAHANDNFISIVIPCYNSQQSIVKLVESIVDECESGEIILVNDASSDETWAKIGELSGLYPDKVIGIDLLSNSGQHAALLVGIRSAKGDVIVTMDDDLQHKPSEIFKLASQVRAGADLVYGVSKDPQQNWFRKITSKSSLWFFEYILGMKNMTQSSAFRAFSNKVSKGFESFKGSVVDIDAILSWTCKRVETCEIVFNQREHGRSNYNFRKLLSHAIKMVVAFSIVPLKLAFYIGLLTTFFAVLLIGYFLYQYIFGIGVIEGFTFLACSIMFFSGIQLFIIGIFGQYLGAIHTQTLGRPVAIIRQTTRDSQE